MTKKTFEESDSDFYDDAYFATMQLRYQTDAHGSRMRTILSGVGNLDGKSLLDVGCGGGFFTHEFTNSGAKEVLGIDYSQHAIAYAKRTFPNSKAVFRQHSAYNLQQIPKESYDTLTIIDVIEHMSDQDALLEGVRHSLKDGGLVIISTDVEENLWSSKFFGKWLRRVEWLSHEGRMYRAIKICEGVRKHTIVNYHDSHVATLTYEQIVDLLEKHDFRITEHKVFPVVGVPFRDFLLKLLPQKHRGDHQYIAAVKMDKKVQHNIVHN